MSRFTTKPQETTTIVRGSDHAIGYFIDVLDHRFAGTEKDPQGEGYLVEWSELFDFSINLIGITKDQLKDDATINKKVNDFVAQLHIRK